ncbi:hypothetical protein EC973_008810 [Apophysomyces ossiformis]|uniref:Uncharacterized protein n=1 Tax=Apophysomyces ossiformis TaxID=679940 RepID=A0A8H7BYN8_9FUNG|nr:hypothetical protein EC973_008810 [Apophysomyces ossiformis]
MLQTPSSAIDTAMSKLSTYLLQGWVMTDERCHVPECFVPMMRSKDGSIRFCVNHDPNPTSSAVGNAQSSVSQQLANGTTASTIVKQAASSDVSPVAAAQDNTEEDELRIRRKRREQSSKASQLIGQKLLQRWVLLNETCPNEDCYAVPLMRNPSTKHMFCVICERNYVSEEQIKQQEEGKEVTEMKETQEKTAIAPPAQHPQRETEQVVHQDSVPESITKVVTSTHESITAVSKNVPADQATSVGITDILDTRSVFETLTRKMNQLTRTAEDCHEPTKLKEIFNAIQACAEAIQACIGVEEAYSRKISTRNI